MRTTIDLPVDVFLKAANTPCREQKEFTDDTPGDCPRAPDTGAPPALATVFDQNRTHNPANEPSRSAGGGNTDMGGSAEDRPPNKTWSKPPRCIAMNKISRKYILVAIIFAAAIIFGLQAVRHFKPSRYFKPYVYISMHDSTRIHWKVKLSRVHGIWKTSDNQEVEGVIGDRLNEFVEVYLRKHGGGGAPLPGFPFTSGGRDAIFGTLEISGQHYLILGQDFVVLEEIISSCSAYTAGAGAPGALKGKP